MSTQERVIKIVAQQLGEKEEKVTLSSRFQEDLGADSLDVVELIMALEEEFGIEIPDEDADLLRTVKQLINYIDQRLKQKSKLP